MTTPQTSTAASLTGTDAIAILQHAIAIIGTAVALAILSNLLIPLPFTPVPMSLATLGVLAAAGTLGPLRAGLGTGLFLLAGIAGVPWFAASGAGWGTPTLGYVVGYVLAAVVVGKLVDVRTGGRTSRIFGVMLIGSLIVYAVGAPWLLASLGTDLAQTLQLGVVPFLLGDLLKVAAATALTREVVRMRR